MTKTSLCLTLNNVKQQAKTLRNFLAGNNIEISHSQSLEALAKQHGLKDWNILSKFLKTSSTSEFPELGDEVSGIYKKQSFTGRVTRHFYSDISGAKGITFHFHKAVDVVTSEHFTNLRQNVSLIMGKDGISLDYKGREDGMLVLNLT